MDEQQIDIIIYHGEDCNDGFCCAVLAAKAYSNIKIIAAKYGDKPPNVKDKRVIIADFSYSRDILIQMKEEAKEFLVFDHHKTAQFNCEGLEFCTFDMKECGSSLLNKWLNTFNKQQWPDFIEYIKDRDLWLKQLPNNAEFHAWISSFPKTLDSWFKAIEQFYKSNSWINEGKSLLRMLEQEVEKTAAKAWFQEIAGYKIPVVNNTNRSITSDLLNKLCKGYPFAALFWKEDNRIVWSLRSNENGIDVSEIAQKYGGGGHKHAAGFQTP